MSHPKLRRRKRRSESDTPSRPSLLFIIAILLGIALLTWAGVRFATTRMDVPQKTPPASKTR